MMSSTVSKRESYYRPMIYPHEPIIKAHTYLNAYELNKRYADGKRKYNIMTVVVWHNQRIYRNTSLNQKVNTMEKNTTYADAYHFALNAINHFNCIHGFTFTPDYTVYDTRNNYVVSHPHTHIYFLVDNDMITKDTETLKKFEKELDCYWINICNKYGHPAYKDRDFFAGPLYFNTNNKDNYVWQYKSNSCLTHDLAFHKFYGHYLRDRYGNYKRDANGKIKEVGHRLLTSNDNLLHTFHSAYILARDVSKYAKIEYPFYHAYANDSYLRRADLIHSSSLNYIHNVPYWTVLEAHKLEEQRYDNGKGLKPHYYYGQFKKDYPKFAPYNQLTNQGIKYNIGWVNKKWLEEASNNTNQIIL